MRFTGFSPRAALVRKYLGAQPEDFVLEIGPGSGNTARAVIGRTAGYWGVDISAEAVRGLRDAYGARKDVVFSVSDVCGDAFLGRTFDRVFSMDTLEHVADARAFFRFAARHLVPGGTALVCFPNGMREKKGRAHSAPNRHVEHPRDPETMGRSGSAESAGEGIVIGNIEGEARHGITWFERRGELEGAVCEAGFEIEELLEIRDSAWQKFVRAVLWEGPRTVALGMLRILRTIRGKKRSTEERENGIGKGGERRHDFMNQADSGSRRPSERDTYEGTESFLMNKRGGIVRDAAALWARFAEAAARIFPPYRARPAGDEILGRRILVRLRKPLTPPPVRSILAS